MFYSREFLDELFLNKDRELYVRITLLTWDELKIKEIFSANKNATGKIYVSSMGLAKVTFEEESIKVTYFVARNNN